MIQTIEPMRADTADFVFRVAGDDGDRLRVTAFSGTERISRLFHFHVELVSDESDIDPAAMLGSPCTLSLTGPGGVRPINGMVRSFARTREGSRLSHYAAEIVPEHWLLSQRIGCRIFQEHNCPDMTVPGIVRQVLRDAGIAEDRVRIAAQREYAARDYVVQYRESELDFIGRLMEAEGIFYFFEHGEDGHVMVLADAPGSTQPAPRGDELPYRGPTGLAAGEEHVFSLNDLHEMRIGRVGLRDYNFTRPAMDLWAKATAVDHTALRFEDYPGGYFEKPPGDVLAQTRLEEQQCGRRTVRMSATTRGLLPGFRFKLIEHPVEALNIEYLALQVEHVGRMPQSGEAEAIEEGDGAQYEARIVAVPAEVTYRPPRVTPRPVVEGTQTAVVVGPKDEELYTDKHGRVKVQFHWDRTNRYDERSSCWIRVSQGWAGGKYGMLFLPRVGHEVIVDFLEGDPDRPIVIGCVYNGDLTPIWDLPEERHRSGIKSKTLAGDGASALIFDDTAGEERVHLHAQRTMEITSEANRVDGIGGDLDHTVGGDRREAVKGYYEIKTGGDWDELVGGNKVVEVSGNRADRIAGGHIKQSAVYVNKVSGVALIEASGGLCLRSGGNFIHIHEGGIDILGTVVNINSGGGALAFNNEAPAADIAGAEGGPDVSHGYDVEYAPYEQSEETGALGQSLRGGEPAEPPKKTTWIEIEMVDEAQQPWAGETYEIVTPDGKTLRGALDEHGMARVETETPGDCQIRFPKLDAAAWERT